jgi:hypothetical protein
MRMRISRPRKEFGHEGFSFIDREAGESNVEIKVTKAGYFTKKKVLEIALQAANKMKVNSNHINRRYMNFFYRDFNLKLITTAWSMLLYSMILRISYLK